MAAAGCLLGCAVGLAAVVNSPAKAAKIPARSMATFPIMATFYGTKTPPKKNFPLRGQSCWGGRPPPDPPPFCYLRVYTLPSPKTWQYLCDALSKVRDLGKFGDLAKIRVRDRNTPPKWRKMARSAGLVLQNIDFPCLHHNKRWLPCYGPPGREKKAPCKAL